MTSHLACKSRLDTSPFEDTPIQKPLSSRMKAYKRAVYSFQTKSDQSYQYLPSFDLLRGNKRFKTEGVLFLGLESPSDKFLVELEEPARKRASGGELGSVSERPRFTE